MAFDDLKIHVRFKLFAAWSSLMFFYVYGDYFELYQPGKLQAMQSLRTPLGTTSQGILLVMASIMIIPCVMPFLTLVLPARVNRWVNIIFGALYAILMIVAIQGGWHYYVLFGLIEVALSGVIVWYAWTWPKQSVD
jgi:hypothetical protein